MHATKKCEDFPAIALEKNCFVETWYDQKGQYFVSVAKDGEGNQIGDAYYDGHSDGVPSSRESLCHRATFQKSLRED